MDDLKKRCARYVGVPRRYHGMTPAGWDCWGMVHYIATHELGCDWPDYQDAYAKAKNGENAATANAVALCISRWRVCAPRPGTVACFDMRGTRRKGPPRIYHIGLIISDHEMIHVLEDKNTLIERFDGFCWSGYFAGARIYDPEYDPHAL